MIQPPATRQHAANACAHVSNSFHFEIPASMQKSAPLHSMGEHAKLTAHG